MTNRVLLANSSSLGNVVTQIEAADLTPTANRRQRFAPQVRALRVRSNKSADITDVLSEAKQDN